MHLVFIYVYIERHTDSEREADRPTERKIDKQRDIERGTDRIRERERDSERGREMCAYVFLHVY